MLKHKKKFILENAIAVSWTAIADLELKFQALALVSASDI